MLTERHTHTQQRLFLAMFGFLLFRSLMMRRVRRRQGREVEA